MKEPITRVYQRYFRPELHFRVRLFNVLAIGGTLISFLMALLSAFNASGIAAVAVNLAISALSFGLLSYAQRSERYQTCYMVTNICIFIVLFPVLFFLGGGYHGGMPVFFVFAVVFTIFMLEGKKALVFALAELALYAIICFAAYLHPNAVIFFESEQDLFEDILVVHQC